MLILALGVGLSAFLAIEWRDSARDANRKAFQFTAADLSGALAAKLNTNVGLTRTMRARAAMGTQDDETGFLQWYDELQRGSPSPPDVVATLIELVRPAGLPGTLRAGTGPAAADAGRARGPAALDHGNSLPGTTVIPSY